MRRTRHDIIYAVRLDVPLIRGCLVPATQTRHMQGGGQGPSTAGFPSTGTSAGTCTKRLAAAE